MSIKLIYSRLVSKVFKFETISPINYEMMGLVCCQVESSFCDAAFAAIFVAHLQRRAEASLDDATSR